MEPRVKSRNKPLGFALVSALFDFMMHNFNISLLCLFKSM